MQKELIVMEFIKQFLQESTEIINQLDISQIEMAVKLLSMLRSQNGRLFILGVGGGAGHASHAVNVSPNLVEALQYAKKVGSNIIGIVGRDGGYTKQVADLCILIPTCSTENITPHAEAFQSIIWHLLVSHPKLKQVPTKWETVL